MKTDLIASLSDLQALGAKTEQAERSILEQATRMLDDLSGQIKAAQDAAKLGDAEAEARYQKLVLDRGKLNITIARAREALGE